MWFFTTLIASVGCYLIGSVLGGKVGWGLFLIFVALWRDA